LYEFKHIWLKSSTQIQICKLISENVYSISNKSSAYPASERL